MEPFQHTQSAPSAHPSHTLASDDTKDGPSDARVANPFKAPNPRHTEVGTFVPVHGPSPSYELGKHYGAFLEHQFNPDSPGPTSWDNTNRPPTPPRQDEKYFGPIQQWLAQKNLEHQASPDIPNVQQTEPHIHQKYQYFPHLQCPPFTARQPVDYLEAPYPTLYLTDCPDEIQSHLLQSQAGASRLPSIANLLGSPLIQSRSSLTSHESRLQACPQGPPTQHWPTSNLARQHGRKTSKPLNIRPVQPSPSQIGTLDAETRRKQDTYHAKGQAMRKGRERRGRKTKRTTHISSRVDSALLPCTITQPLIYSPLPTYPPPLQPQHVFYDEPMNWESHNRGYEPVASSNSYHYTAAISNSFSNPPLSLQLSAPQTAWDDLEQSITSNYEEYKWSIKLYEVKIAQYYDFAQAFLEDLFKYNLHDTIQYKWHTHTTTGFIKDGDRLSFVVLQNAANPFTWGMAPDSTTSIGVYGRYSNLQEKTIHWKTLAPNISDILQMCVDQEYIQVKQKWHVDMTKASDRRFHRAYWMAANMMPLKGLLGHALPDEKAHDAVDEDLDDDFEVTEADLQSSWANEDVTEEQSADAWAKILEHNEFNDAPENGYEHVVTGNSEWDQFGS
ncbi:hypothetical protein BKA66DRAFT_566154 [Pyrenochaeta sp. MPI-SDFR-AT-0127]|nr:hypothetical protein BKA66DRAFT_566154 [Pyrenochaeta sp. MPI-SDFR-AT-0127]